ncbi:hypothetical protein TcYC6_0089050 [Trypanosoma cruzi]|nr:hypothetical protein TcYC6_0089050 [Trypanosoma cruzi]
MAEAASCLDVKASFFQVSLPRGTRHLFRCRVEDGTLVELTRLPMGYKASPEILQIIITSAIAGVTTVVHRLWAAPPLVRIDVWIGNIRIAESISDVTLWEAQVLRNADSCHATIGRIANRALRITPFCGCGLIKLTRRYPRVTSLSVLYAPCRRLILQQSRKWRLRRHAFYIWLPFWARVYATTTFSSRQCDDDYPQLTGELCWRHPRPTFRRQRLVWARDYDT